MPEDREPDAPDMPHANTRTPLHGPTGGVPSDKALSDREKGAMLVRQRIVVVECPVAFAR
eukprot:scaffold17434_cov114-Isochrysis_galbana.AAC.1